MRLLSLFLGLAFAFCSPAGAPAQVRADQGGTGTTANTGASGYLLIGQGNSTYLEKLMSGDCTLLATGAITCSASGSNIIFDIGDDGGNDSTALGEIATTGDTASIFTEGADKLTIAVGNPWPTCTALAANGGNCSAGSYARGVDASGVAENCVADDDTPDSNSEVPDAITLNIGGGGSVLGGTPNRCAQFGSGGVLESASGACAAAGTGDVVGPSGSTDTAICLFDGTTGKLVKNSACLVDTSGNLDCAGTVEGSCTAASSNCGVDMEDNTADHAAPGAGRTVVYSKSGATYQRAGAAGAASALLDIAGRSLTKSTNTVDADAELYTDSGCASFGAVTTGQQQPTVWIAPTALTITSIYCEMTGGTSVGADLNNDDGSATGVNGSDIVCDASETDSSLAGDVTMAAGDRLDVDIGTVTGAVTNFSICLNYTKDD